MNTPRRAKRRKQDYEKHIRITVTIPPKLHEECLGIFRKYGFSGASDYLQARIRKDAGLELPS